MPNEQNVQTMFTGPTGNPATFNESTLYAGGSLGQVLEKNTLSYQLVKADSGATASTATGVIAAAQLAFIKDPANYLVTNDATQAIGGSVTNAYRNFVAGVFQTSVTAGNYCFILQRGSNVSVKMTSGGGVGQRASANSGTAADAVAVTVGTAYTYNGLGVLRGAAANNLVNIDLDIPSMP